MNICQKKSKNKKNQILIYILFKMKICNRIRLDQQVSGQKDQKLNYRNSKIYNGKIWNKF